MKKNPYVWIAVITLLIGAGLYGYYIIYTLDSNQENASSSGSLATSVARTGDLTIVASGSGQVIPASQVDLDFETSGTVIEIPVRVGDLVQAGEVLARLDSDQSEAELAAEIAQAELALVQAERDLADLYADAELAAAQALIDLEAAQQDYDDLSNTAIEEAAALVAIAQAESEIETAEMLLYIYNSSPSEDEIYTAYASLLFKQGELEDLQKQLTQTLKSISGARSDSARDRAESQLLQLNVRIANQTITVEDAVYHLETIDDAPESLEVSLAESQLATAQAQLAAAQNDLAEIQSGPQPGDLAVAEAELQAAQAEWERLKDGPDPDDIAFYQARLEEARNELIIAQEATAIIELTAPINAMVIDLNIDIGDRLTLNTETSGTSSGSTSASFEDQMFEMLFGGAGSGSNTSSAAVTLADLSQPLLEIYIDETDLYKVGLGYPVEVSFDALPDETFSGTIIAVSQEIDDDVVARVLLEYAKPSSLPINLNALVDVIAGETVDAILVPVEALVETGPDSYGVYQVVDGEPQLVEVSIGLMDFTSVEITQGIQAGDTVALSYQPGTD